MDPRRSVERAVCGVRDLGCMGRLEQFGLVSLVAAHHRRIHDEVYQLQLVAQIQRHQAGIVYLMQLDRRDCVCAGGGVFHQSVHLPELPDSFVIVGKDLACGGFPVRKQDGIRCACAADAAQYAARTTYHAELVRRRKELHRPTALELQTSGRLDQSAKRRYRRVQFPCR